MDTLKLEVGKYYRNYKGEEVLITSQDDSKWPFNGDDGRSYMPNGKYFSEASCSDLDLIFDGYEGQLPSSTMKASAFLSKASSLMVERGKQYDADDNQEERSMGKAVASFNVITGHNLTESEGWLLMQQLKDVRQWAVEDYHQDSAEDCVAYSALKAEALAEGK